MVTRPYVYSRIITVGVLQEKESGIEDVTVTDTGINRISLEFVIDELFHCSLMILLVFDNQFPVINTPVFRNTVSFSLLPFSLLVLQWENSNK